jgi:hypothetical protein
MDRYCTHHKAKPWVISGAGSDKKDSGGYEQGGTTGDACSETGIFTADRTLTG